MGLELAVDCEGGAVDFIMTVVPSAQVCQNAYTETQSGKIVVLVSVLVSLSSSTSPSTPSLPPLH